MVVAKVASPRTTRSERFSSALAFDFVLQLTAARLIASTLHRSRPVNCGFSLRIFLSSKSEAETSHKSFAFFHVSRTRRKSSIALLSNNWRTYLRWPFDCIILRLLNNINKKLETSRNNKPLKGRSWIIPVRYHRYLDRAYCFFIDSNLVAISELHVRLEFLCPCL